MSDDERNRMIEWNSVATRRLILTLIEAAVFCDRYRLFDEAATTALEIRLGEGEPLALVRLQGLLRDAIDDCSEEIARLAMECREDAMNERN